MAPRDGNPLAVSVRVGRLKGTSYPGQRKHDLRIGRQPAYVDQARTGLNRVLMEPPSPAALRDMCAARYATRSTRKLSKAALLGVSGIITFGERAQALFGALDPAAQDAAYLEVCEAVATRLGTTLEGAVVHEDETAPHLHFVLAGYGEDGLPVSPRMGRAAMAALQDDAAEIMGRHCPGIERGHRARERRAAGASWEETTWRTTSDMHAAMGHGPGSTSSEIAATVARRRKEEAAADMAVERREAEERKAGKLRAEMDVLETRIGKLEAREADLSAREAKRLSAYRGRLERKAVRFQALKVPAPEPDMTLEELDEVEAAQVSSVDAALEGRAGHIKRDRAALDVERQEVATRASLVKAAHAEVATIEGALEQLEQASTLVALGQALPEPTPNQWRCGPRRDRQEWERAGMAEELKKYGFGRMMWTVIRRFGRRLAEAYHWDWTEDPAPDAKPEAVPERD